MASRPDYDDVLRLVNKMREGSTQARRELIEAHVGLAFKVSQEYEDDEALSDALCTLVEEVDRFRVSGRHPAALPSYLKVALSRAAGRHKRDTSGKEAREGGGRVHRHCATNDAIRFLRSGREVPTYRDQEVVDLMDQLLASCEVEEERQMVFLRSQSLNNHEVALRLGVSIAHVQKSMARLELRFQVRERLDSA